MSDKKTEEPTAEERLAQAREEAIALVAEYEPEHLDGRSQSNYPEGRGNDTTGIMKMSLIDACTAIIFYNGNLTRAAREFGMSRNVVQRNRKTHPALEAAIKTSRETFKDELEDELRYQIFKKHEFIPLLFALKTQARDRGYIEGVINVNTINFNDFTTEQLKRLKAGESISAVLADNGRLRAPEEVIDAKVEDAET